MVGNSQEKVPKNKTWQGILKKKYLRIKLFHKFKRNKGTCTFGWG
jgi:hypothetical protein